MILIAIGANLPLSEGVSAIDTCESAVAAMRGINGLTFRAMSAWYRTAAIPRSDQPDYCNGVIRFSGDVEAAALLAQLHEIEGAFGRQRSLVNAARTIDLDIVDLNGLIRATPAPVLPHPRAHLRAFVLRPILDVAPAWRHPTLRQNASMLLSELAHQSIQPWYDLTG